MKKYLYIIASLFILFFGIEQTSYAYTNGDYVPGALVQLNSRVLTAAGDKYISDFLTFSDYRVRIYNYEGIQTFTGTDLTLYNTGTLNVTSGFRVYTLYNNNGNLSPSWGINGPIHVVFISNGYYLQGGKYYRLFYFVTYNPSNRVITQSTPVYSFSVSFRQSVANNVSPQSNLLTSCRPNPTGTSGDFPIYYGSGSSDVCEPLPNGTSVLATYANARTGPFNVYWNTSFIKNNKIYFLPPDQYLYKIDNTLADYLTTPLNGCDPLIQGPSNSFFTYSGSSIQSSSFPNSSNSIYFFSNSLRCGDLYYNLISTSTGIPYTGNYGIVISNQQGFYNDYNSGSADTYFSGTSIISSLDSGINGWFLGRYNGGGYSLTSNIYNYTLKINSVSNVTFGSGNYIVGGTTNTGATSSGTTNTGTTNTGATSSGSIFGLLPGLSNFGDYGALEKSKEYINDFNLFNSGTVNVGTGGLTSGTEYNQCLTLQQTKPGFLTWMGFDFVSNSLIQFSCNLIHFSGIGTIIKNFYFIFDTGDTPAHQKYLAGQMYNDDWYGWRLIENYDNDGWIFTMPMIKINEGSGGTFKSIGYESKEVLVKLFNGTCGPKVNNSTTYFSNTSTEGCGIDISSKDFSVSKYIMALLGLGVTAGFFYLFYSTFTYAYSIYLGAAQVISGIFLGNSMISPFGFDGLRKEDTGRLDTFSKGMQETFQKNYNERQFENLQKFNNFKDKIPEMYREKASKENNGNVPTFGKK